MINYFNLAQVVIIAGVTAMLRFLPFIIFGKDKKTPDYIMYLGKVLPYAIMGMLVVYCLKGISFTAPASWIPEIIASLLVVVLHVWKRNTLLSILAGTVTYMVLINIIM